MRFEDYLISCGYRFVVNLYGTRTGWYRNAKRAGHSILLALYAEYTELEQSKERKQ
jgi:hypothetical protein